VIGHQLAWPDLIAHVDGPLDASFLLPGPVDSSWDGLGGDLELLILFWQHLLKPADFVAKTTDSWSYCPSTNG